MSAKAIGIFSKNVVTPTGVQPALVAMENGTISGVYCAPPTLTSESPRSDFEAWLQSEQFEQITINDVDTAVVMPGLVDSHVHINEPGRTQWEGFATATKAAAAGGITVLADMPLNSMPVTTSPEALQLKLEAAGPQLWVDCAFFGGVVPGNAALLESLIEAGVAGFKCFLIDSGIDDFPAVLEDDLRQAMPILARHALPLLVHAELDCRHDTNPAVWIDERSYQAFLHSRPARWEDDAIALLLDLCAEFRCPVHIVHLSSAGMLPRIKAARGQGLPFTVETCPHYLTFAAEEIVDGDTRYKCAPPIREGANREKLWAALADGTIDIVVSDHSPCLPDLKFLSEGDLKQAWGGISSLQFRLPVVWTQAKKRGFGLEDIASWLCSGPAEFLGIGDRKGKLAAGYDADIVIWDQDATIEIDQSMIQHRHKITPYQGQRLCGKVLQTYLGGCKIFDGKKVVEQAEGKVLVRKKMSLNGISKGRGDGT